MGLKIILDRTVAIERSLLLSLKQTRIFMFLAIMLKKNHARKLVALYQREMVIITLLLQKVNHLKHLLVLLSQFWLSMMKVAFFALLQDIQTHILQLFLMLPAPTWHLNRTRSTDLVNQKRVTRTQTYQQISIISQIVFTKSMLMMQPLSEKILYSPLVTKVQ